MGAQRETGMDLNVYLSREETERQILAAYGPRSWLEVPERRSRRRADQGAAFSHQNEEVSAGWLVP
jgi:hypothetical protein